MSLRTLFSRPTIADLADVIDDMRTDANAVANAPDPTDSGLRAISELGDVDIEDLLGSYGS